jgi:DNA-binding transcriptional ArsR family regulator
MHSSPDLTAVASLIGDASRIAILLSLLGGKSLPASELARAARITPQTASSHLTKLVEGGLLVHESYGRHRYYRLANAEVAHALEALNAIALPKPVRSLRESEQVKTIRFARTCYDHLAGEIGVALAARMLAMQLLAESGQDYVLTEDGKQKLRSLGVELAPPSKSRRSYARQCLDWSERRHHIAGCLGAALTKRLFELGWIERYPEHRGVRITKAGIQGFSEEFGLIIKHPPASSQKTGGSDRAFS